MHQINHQSHDKCWDKGAFSKNTKNDKRLRQSVEKIENAFVEALQAKKLSQISVSDVCKAAEMNRSSFYANFVDIYALADQVKAHLEDEVNQLYALEVEQKFNSNAYHITFFKIGLNAIIKRWLNGGCRETPEEMNEIIRSEYHSRCP